ncbi:GTP cyclohydrolase I [Thalassoporum mexicanum]|uniref:GTP cyclohydrolase I n=1 Tax=Thalassoporum mexicanum TaxID=3457544 RepID=UPI0002F3FFF7|nr:GTP cyclohydrolase I [Pseudanabaena sp. PCC 7367]
MTTSYRQSKFINPDQDPNRDLTSFTAKENGSVGKPISKVIRERLKSLGVKYFANDSIAEYISDGEREELKLEIEDKLQGLFDALVIDTDNDHNTHETAFRMAKMYVDEVFKGRYHPMPKVTDFPNAKALDEIYVLGPISVRSACSHHFVPIIGHAWLGIVPSDRVIGISKFNRIVDWVLSRPHIQEEAAVMVADTIERLIQPRGLAFVIKAQHMCMSWRGVKEPETQMTNSIVRGTFREDPTAKKEFFDLIRGHGF